MTSLHNRYFHEAPKNEQRLVQKLVTEAIQIMGISCFYLPRQLQNLDLIMGEDPISKFTIALPIEMYIETFAGWQGASELIAKFQLEIRNKITFSIAVDRWEQEVQKISSSMWVSKRPQEGDLIYDTITKKLVEIKFVNQDFTFYQLGKMAYAYRMDCEMFQYSHETITTGITDLDNQVNSKNLNLVNMLLMNEDNTMLLQEDGYNILLDIPSTSSSYDSTTVLQQEGTVINFNPNNPFANL